MQQRRRSPRRPPAHPARQSHQGATREADRGDARNRARRSPRQRARDQRRADRYAGRHQDPSLHARLWHGAAWAIWPLLALLFIIWITPEAGPAWQAAHGRGTLGTLTVEHQDCGKAECTQRGPFVSTDAKLTFPEARLTEPDLVMDPGQHIQVLYEGDAPQVFRADGSHRWIEDDLLLFASIVTLAIWCRQVTLALRSRPRQVQRPRP